jgi:hypothetical protein
LWIRHQAHNWLHRDILIQLPYYHGHNGSKLHLSDKDNFGFSFILGGVNEYSYISNCLWFVNGSGQNVQSLERTFYRCFTPSFSSFGWGVSEEKIKMWKVNRRRTPSDGKSSCYWQTLSHEVISSTPCHRSGSSSQLTA